MPHLFKPFCGLPCLFERSVAFENERAAKFASRQPRCKTGPGNSPVKWPDVLIHSAVIVMNMYCSDVFQTVRSLMRTVEMSVTDIVTNGDIVQLSHRLELTKTLEVSDPIRQVFKQ